MNRFLLFSLLLGMFFMANCSKKMGFSALEPPTDEAFENILIDQETDGDQGPCEPSIFINPANKNQLVAGAILNRVYTSSDGGRTWKKNTLSSSYGVWGDPAITADQKGNFYFSHLSDPSGFNWASTQILDRIVVQKSTDQGKTWNDGSFAGMHHPKDQDKQWLTTSPYNGDIYMTWTEFDQYGSGNSEDKSRILFSKSTDQGASWTEAISISRLEGDCIDDDNTTEGAVPAVGVNGEIFVSWSFNEKIYFNKSMDGGKTWLKEEMAIADQPGGWSFDVPGINRTNGMPVTCTDLSKSKYRGTIYVNWSDQKNGKDDTDIWMIKSIDAGNSWSAPVRVNDDAPGKHNFLTWMSVDPKTGTVFVVFYDRRNYSDGNTDVYLAYSNDGGLTFENKKISKTPFTPVSTVFFGDYNNICAFDGKVRPIWTSYQAGKLSIWTAIIDFR